MQKQSSIFASFSLNSECGVDLLNVASFVITWVLSEQLRHALLGSQVEEVLFDEMSYSENKKESSLTHKRKS